MKRSVKFLVLAITTALFFGCQKYGGEGELAVRMTDAPGNYDSVMVEVETVQVHYAGGQGWTTLNTNNGIYDLLLLQDSVTVLIANQNSIPVGDITQMRVILGDNNWVVVDSTSHPLLLSSQDKTGIKINVNAPIQANTQMVIVLDFDAYESIVEEGNGMYRLKPVIKVDSLYYVP
ncbi:MAG: DUF4382 domain-containing protein [Crocinitomicaceae bacterium]|nr:DUF4382 domain-containing protein [Crocinitomicaceae bacterium]